VWRTPRIQTQTRGQSGLMLRALRFGTCGRWPRAGFAAFEGVDAGGLVILGHQLSDESDELGDACVCFRVLAVHGVEGVSLQSADDSSSFSSFDSSLKVRHRSNRPEP
jgi:hypothetical protein